MFRLKPFYLFLIVTVFSVFFISACSSDVPTENGGGTEVTPDNPSKPNVTPVNEFPKNPMALLGIYDVTRESINGQEKAVAEGSEFRVNVDTSKLNQQKVEVLMRLNIDNKLLDMKREVSLAGENLDEKFFNKTFTNLGAKVTGKYTLEFTMKGDSYPELVKEGIITNNDTLVILLDKTKDLAIGTGLDDKPVTPEEIPVTDIIIDTPTDKKFFKGSTVRIDFSLQPITTTDTKVSWQTDKGQSGEVTAVNGKGSISIKNVTETCVLTIRTMKDHVKTYTINIVNEVESINFLKPLYVLNQDEIVTIEIENYDILKDQFTSIIYTAKNNNENTIKILDDKTGKIQGLSNGVVTLEVTATKLNGKPLKAECNIDVLGNINYNNEKSLTGTYEIVFFGTNSNGSGMAKAVISNNCNIYKELWGSGSTCPEGTGGYLIPENDYAGKGVIKVENGMIDIQTKVAFVGSRTIQNLASDDQYQYSIYDKKTITQYREKSNKGNIGGRNLSGASNMNNATYYIDEHVNYTGKTAKDIIVYSKIEKDLGLLVGKIYPDTRLLLRKISSQPTEMDQNSLKDEPFNKLDGRLTLK